MPLASGRLANIWRENMDGLSECGQYLFEAKNKDTVLKEEWEGHPCQDLRIASI